MTVRLNNLKKQIEQLRTAHCGFTLEPPEGFPYLPPYDQAYFWRSEAHFLQHKQINIMEDFGAWSAYMKEHSAKNPAHPWHQRDGVPDCILKIIDYENSPTTTIGRKAEANK